MRNYANEKTSTKKKSMNKLLISVNVVGSSGPLRFLVKPDDSVASVIHTALKSYAREDRLPVLGLDPNNFLLYCPHQGWDALSPLEQIGCQGGRNFVLYKKPLQQQMTEVRSEKIVPTKGNSWKTWLHKSLHFKILSHLTY